MALDYLIDAVSSLIDSATDNATSLVNGAHQAAGHIGEVIQEASQHVPMADYSSVAAQFGDLPQDITFGAHDWVDPAHSGYLYERIDGVYTGNYVKA